MNSLRFYSAISLEFELSTAAKTALPPQTYFSLPWQGSMSVSLFLILLSKICRLTSQRSKISKIILQKNSLRGDSKPTHMCGEEIRRLWDRECLVPSAKPVYLISHSRFFHTFFHNKIKNKENKIIYSWLNYSGILKLMRLSFQKFV